jgi:hypothetical protein
MVLFQRMNHDADTRAWYWSCNRWSMRTATLSAAGISPQIADCGVPTSSVILRTRHNELRPAPRYFFRLLGPSPALTLGCKSGDEHFLQAVRSTNGLKELSFGAGFESLDAPQEIN